MNQSIYDKLTQVNQDQQKPVLAAYLREQINRRNTSPERSQEIAYEITGLLSTDFALSLDESDPYFEILTMAGQLELPAQYQGMATWKRLAELVQALPK
jgi:hypothetical protein